MSFKQLHQKWDWGLIILVFTLTGLGLMMILSSSFLLAQRYYGDPYHFFKKQTFYAFIGFIFIIGLVRYIPYQRYQRLTYPLLLFAILGLLLVFVPGLGKTTNGATRWIKIGPFSFQPSELVKIVYIIYLAALLSRQEKIKSFSTGVLPGLIIYAIIAGFLILEPDMGTVVFLGGLTLCMFFIGGVKIKHLFLTTCPILFALIYLLISAPYRVKRVLEWLNFLNPLLKWLIPELNLPSDPLGVGYIILHSKLAFASGGILGQGLGGSQQKLFYLPEPYTDYIFSIIGEELGFCGVFLVVFLFLLLFWRGIKIARAARDLFGFYLALGTSLWFFMQASIHMGVCLGLLPPKGITLPFISYGGTALWANLIGIGILENIYMQGRR